MPDLHGWISQKIDAVEEAARACPPSPLAVETGPSDYVATEIRDTAGQVRATGMFVTTATVLRRATADRKILELHRYAGGNSWDQYACHGCGYDDTGYLVDHTNDCETLLALAEGYGITEDELAGLDRPEAERTAAGAGKPLAEALTDAFDQFAAEQLEERFLGDLTVHKFTGLLPVATDLLQPTPLERALDILSPHLRDVPLYRPTA